jgi:hypothetical protein
MTLIDKLESAIMPRWRDAGSFLQRAGSRWDYRKNPGLAALYLLVVVGLFLAPYTVYERHWRLGMEQHGIVATATVTGNSGPSRRRQRDYVAIAWRDGTTVRTANVTVSPNYLSQMLAKPQRTVTIRHRNGEAIILDDVAFSTAQLDSVTPALIFLLVSFSGCLLLHARARWRKV